MDHIALKWLHNLKPSTGRLARLLDMTTKSYTVNKVRVFFPDDLSRSGESTKACSKDKPKVDLHDDILAN